MGMETLVVQVTFCFFLWVLVIQEFFKILIKFIKLTIIICAFFLHVAIF